MNRIWEFFGGALGIVWMLLSPITYILSVVHTWQGKGSVLWKIIHNLTFDAAAAAFWPIAWAVWGLRHYLGYDTPIRLLAG